ncbi:hypothetical protein DRQ25_14950, partial [Candidatus Fermentibacteria bacterium]
LIDKYNDGMEGAVLVGNIPVAWVKMDDSFPGQSHFPCDYFYMDLDGTWQDLWVGYPSGGNLGTDGIYDTFSGSLNPEIYTGRIKTDNLDDLGDPIEMLNDYIKRTHEWRMNGGSDTLTALCYVDDAWAVSGESYRSAMQLLYPNTILVNDYSATNGDDYIDNRLPDTYVWISPFVHSSPTVHYWEQGSYTTWDEIVPANPQAHFYNLFACSNSRFTRKCMGSIYAFATSTGLASIGSTKTGSMLRFLQFYNPMGQGSSIGEAFMSWWDYIANGGLTSYEQSWHLGMVLLGDPTLVPAMHLLGIDEQSGEDHVTTSLTVAQNPCQSSMLVLTFGEAEYGTVELYDTAGRIVASGTLVNSSCTLSLSSIGTGYYVARVKAGELSAQTSVVVIK